MTARKLSPAKREKADRIHLRDCTVEREAEALAECRGCEVCARGTAICPADATSYSEGFRDLWAATYGRESWEANPWVWVLRWERAEVRK